MKKFKLLFGLTSNPILCWIVELIIVSGLFNNHGKFKIREKVKYNLFAKIVIGGILKKGATYTIKEYPIWSKKKSNVYFEESSGCDVFWLRRLYPWEK